MIHEQNSSAGKANVLLAKYADAVVACYESCSSQFPAAKTRYYGNPDATVAAQCRRDPQLIRSYGLDPEQPLVLFMKLDDKRLKLTPKRIEMLKQLGIFDTDALLSYYPFRYDEIQPTAYADFRLKERVVFEGEVISQAKSFRFSRGRSVTSFEVMELGLHISEDQEDLKLGSGYDHHFCVDGEGFRRMVSCEGSRIAMEIRSDLPGFQMYSANFLDGTYAGGKEGGRFPRRSAVCFETQYAPNAINYDGQQKPILKKGVVETHRTEYLFKAR